jgi:hypothetical protein
MGVFEWGKLGGRQGAEGFEDTLSTQCAWAAF